MPSELQKNIIRLDNLVNKLTTEINLSTSYKTKYSTYGPLEPIVVKAGNGYSFLFMDEIRPNYKEIKMSTYVVNSSKLIIVSMSLNLYNRFHAIGSLYSTVKHIIDKKCIIYDKLEILTVKDQCYILTKSIKNNDKNRYDFNIFVIKDSIRRLVTTGPERFVFSEETLRRGNHAIRNVKELYNISINKGYLKVLSGNLETFTKSKSKHLFIEIQKGDSNKLLNITGDFIYRNTKALDEIDFAKQYHYKTKKKSIEDYLK